MGSDPKGNLHVVCFLGYSLEYEFYMPTFRNDLSVPSSYEGRHVKNSSHIYLPMKMEQSVPKVGI